MNGRRKAVTRFITALLVLQGLYVIFPLPDIWPLSNYSMFSRTSGERVASSIQIAGVSKNGEIELNAADILPFDIVRLEKGISRIINNGGQYERKDESRINLVADAFAFLPFDGRRLKRFIKNKLLYNRGGKSAEEDLDSVFNYLFAQYKRNGGAEKFSEMKLYEIRWDWTGVKPAAARDERVLIYSTKKEMTR